MFTSLYKKTTSTAPHRTKLLFRYLFIFIEEVLRLSASKFSYEMSCFFLNQLYNNFNCLPVKEAI